MHNGGASARRHPPTAQCACGFVSTHRTHTKTTSHNPHFLRYFLLAATPTCYALESSLVGSIGVISSTFGAVQAMQRLGLERRVYTAGKQKSLMDPFECVHV